MSGEAHFTYSAPVLHATLPVAHGKWDASPVVVSPVLDKSANWADAPGAHPSPRITASTATPQSHSPRGPKGIVAILAGAQEYKLWIPMIHDTHCALCG
jgi:hypothetical protein